MEAEAAAWFFENSIDLFAVIRDGKIVSINPAWSRISGFSPEETLGHTADEFIHPDDAPVLRRIRQDLSTTGHATGEHRLRTKAGVIKWVEAQVKRLPSGEILLINRDVTATKERERREVENNYVSEILRATAGVTVWRYDPDLHLYEFGADLTQPMGRKSYDGEVDLRDEKRVISEIHPQDVRELGRRWSHTLATGEPGAFEYRHAHGEGWQHVRTAWRGLRQSSSGRWEMLGITQDVTELVGALDAALVGQEAARSAAEAKSQFLANMSHEIRTPMNGVIGVLHLLRNEPLSREARGLIDQALSCGQMLSELLNDVIDLSKIEEGKLELNPEPLDVVIAAQGVVSLLRPQAAAKRLKLSCEAASDLGWMKVDPVRLRQMLFNLIGNAVKFTLQGEVSVRLDAVGRGSDRRLRVAVQDTGIGIAPQVQAELFQRFHQGDGSTTRRFGGSGLGLSITRRLVELMDGEIGVQSTPGEGSTFWFEIAAPAAAPAAHAPESSETWLEGVRVLVVEDNATNRLIATRMLESLGAEVSTAEDGEAGVRAACQEAFDVIFMDVQMPVMDGVEATRAIRALPGPVSETPIVAMTANAMAHQQQSYLDAGMNGAVAKPLSPAALLTELTRLFTAEDNAKDARAA